MGLVEFVVYGWFVWVVLGLFILLTGLFLVAFVLAVKCDDVDNEYRCVRLAEVVVYAMIAVLFGISVVLCLGSLLGMVSVRYGC